MDPFSLDRYLIRRKVFKLFGGAFHIYAWDDPERVCFYAEQKAFKLKEDFTVFGEEAMTTPLLRIRARSVIDFSATYDIDCAKTGQRVGSCRRKGLKSILRDAWEVLGPQEQVIATCAEDSTALALIRRFLANLIPQTYALTSSDGAPLGSFRQFFNPFVFKMELDYGPDERGVLDRRLGIGLAVCIMAIEGRQN